MKGKAIMNIKKITGICLGLTWSFAECFCMKGDYPPFQRPMAGATPSAPLIATGENSNLVAAASAPLPEANIEPDLDTYIKSRRDIFKAKDIMKYINSARPRSERSTPPTKKQILQAQRECAANELYFWTSEGLWKADISKRVSLATLVKGSTKLPMPVRIMDGPQIVLTCLTTRDLMRVVFPYGSKTPLASGATVEWGEYANDSNILRCYIKGNSLTKYPHISIHLFLPNEQKQSSYRGIMTHDFVIGLRLCKILLGVGRDSAEVDRIPLDVLKLFYGEGYLE